MFNSSLMDDELDQLILSEFPYPIAVNYRKLLETEGWEARTRKCIEIFEYGLRAITLGVLSQYLIRDVHEVNDPELDKKLYRHLPEASLGQWVEFLFLSLRAYHGNRELFFMPELYDLYWDTSRKPHRRRKGLRNPFDRLVQIRNDLAHRFSPADETAWELLGREALGHLRAALAQFDFLQHYDLIRVVGQRGDEYEYERYAGQKITTHYEQLHGPEELRMGWFYLSRQDRSVLRLHPLLIFWPGGETLTRAREERWDTAVYDRLLKEVVGYALVVARQMVEERDTELLAQIRELIYYNIEHIKMARKRTILSWPALQEAAAELSARQMETAREKYRPALYLQRNETLQEFQEFLKSDKGCFVLTGKSGVGKSSFVLSLADEYAEREDVALLIYNGARLSIPGTAMQTISQDLARYLTLGDEFKEDLFAALERRGKMAGKTLIIVFDAINENVDGKALLRQIDQLVGEAQYLWLKIMITSRPQAWRTLKRGLHLAEARYYRGQRGGEHHARVSDLTVPLDLFQGEELPKVYEKYRQAYGVQTAYGTLDVSVRDALRDPLLLRLVAEIYRDEPIPEHIRVSDIYDQYMQMLLETGWLYEEDLILLEQELIPLMLTEGHYDNKLTATQIHTARTQKGQPLWELICSDDLLGDGRRVNASYVRLADAEILMKQGPPTDYEITFKYERFYDYYGAKRLFALAKPRETKEVFYRDLVARVMVAPYLWGPVKTALIWELKEPTGQHLIMALAETTDQTMKEMLVAVLGEYGKDDPEGVRSILLTLLATKSRLARLWGRVASLIPGREEVVAEATLQHRIAVEAAYEAHLPDVLSLAARHSSSGTRTVAIQYIHYLWRDGYRKSVIKVLDELRSHMLIWRFPRMNVLFSCIGISALIVFTDYRNRETLRVLQEYWQSILGALLFIRPGQGRLGRSITAAMRSRLVDLASSIGVGLSSTMEQAGGVFGVSDMKLFFSARDDRRDKYARLIPYVGWESPDIGTAEELLCEIAESYDLLTSYLVLAVLDFQLLKDVRRTIEIMRKMLECSLAAPKPTVQTCAMFVAAAFYKNVRNDEKYKPDLKLILDYYKEAMEWLYERSRCRYWGDRREYTFSPLGCFVSLNYFVHGEVDIDYAWEFVQPVIKEGDTQLLAYFIQSLAGEAIGRRLPIPNLEVLKLFFGLDNTQIRKDVIMALSRIRAYFPIEVDEFLEADESSEANALIELRHGVRTSAVGESLGALIMQHGLAFLAYVMIDREGPMMSQFAWWFEEATRVRSFSQWIGSLAKATINLVYGDYVFDTSQPDWRIRPSERAEVTHDHAQC